MSIAQLVAGTVMNKAAALVNDVSRTQYTYAVQVPYLQMAMQELQEYFELHSVPVTEKRSAIIPVDAGIVEVGYDAGPTLAELPDDMVEPEAVWESPRGLDSWIPMTRRASIPVTASPTGQLGIYVWQEQILKFLPSNQNNDVKIDYIRQLFTEITDNTSTINIVNARSFLEFRTAGLLAEFVMHDDPTAQKLNGYASLAMDRATGITVKGKQSIMTRRRPFRSGYKRRS